MTQTYDKPLDANGITTAIDLWTAATSNGIELDKSQIERLERYHNELVYWNERVNLISRKDVHNIYERHILHSLSIVKYAVFTPRARVLDVGTGGGLPGIPVKIARPDVKMTLVDSIRKKVTATQMFADHTGLKDITAVCARAEDLLHSTHYQGGFDVIISRAVARTAEILGWIRPLMKPTAVCYFLKGGNLDEELAEARQANPTMTIVEQPIVMFGIQWFTTDEKKIVLCRF
jgi:16S rRNA (guanine527-N7)-methyltransferase